jgi:hypothetical protein
MVDPSVGAEAPCRDTGEKPPEEDEATGERRRDSACRGRRPSSRSSIPVEEETHTHTHTKREECEKEKRRCVRKSEEERWERDYVPEDVRHVR